MASSWLSLGVVRPFSHLVVLDLEIPSIALKARRDMLYFLRKSMILAIASAMCFGGCFSGYSGFVASNSWICSLLSFLMASILSRYFGFGWVSPVSHLLTAKIGYAHQSAEFGFCQILGFAECLEIFWRDYDRTRFRPFMVCIRCFLFDQRIDFIIA